ncbi:MAG: type I phosphomannose isomerase catalytic subunit [Planctomycetota bacterium]
MPDSQALYPLCFAPIYKHKVWGGDALSRHLGRALPTSDTGDGVGESWELVDLAQTSASGGGGGAERSAVANGPLAGKSLSELIAEHGRAILGDLPLTDAGGFPLLLKYLDASGNLSVQVHPSPEYAANHADAFLKSEAWYIVDREPGAVIYKGMKPGVTPNDLRKALEQNTDDAVVPLMETVPVEPGDCHYLPSGTCHALGEGILVAEVQTPSDTTFRVYDWGRVGRELHIEQALACIHFGPSQGADYEPGDVVTVDGCTTTTLVRCGFFQIDNHQATAGYTDLVQPRQPRLWMWLSGQGVFSGPEPIAIEAGSTWLLPAAMPPCTVQAETDAVWLEITFPQAHGGVLA